MANRVSRRKLSFKSLVVVAVLSFACFISFYLGTQCGSKFGIVRSKRPERLPTTNTSSRWYAKITQEAERIWNEDKYKRAPEVGALTDAFMNTSSLHEQWAIFWKLFPPVYHCPRPVQLVGEAAVCGFSHFGNLHDDCAVYSLGGRDDLDDKLWFEQSVMAGSDCILRLVKPYVKQVPALIKRFAHRIGKLHYKLGKIDDIVYTGKLTTEMEYNDDPFIDILKVDIEGVQELHSLRKLIQDFPRSDPIPIGQILLTVRLEGEPEKMSASSPSSNRSGNFAIELIKWVNFLEQLGFRLFFAQPQLHIPSGPEKSGQGTNSTRLFMDLSFLNSKMKSDYFE